MKYPVLLPCLGLLLLVSLVAVPALAATDCPPTCSCLLSAKAEELGYSVFCGGKQSICGYDAPKNLKYCYALPVKCSSSCSCYTLEEGKEKGYPLCRDTTNPCRYEKGRALYCHQVPVTEKPVSCPSTCTCQQTKPYLEAGYEYCNGEQKVCGEDDLGNPLSCFEKPVTVVPVPVAPVQVPQECPPSCACYTREVGLQKAYTLCGGEETLCGYVKDQVPMYCYQSRTPDLVISDVWTDSPGAFREIRYNIYNRGDGASGASTTALYIDSVKIGEDSIAGLNAGEARVEIFPYRSECSGASDTIRVEADASGAVAESDETNNAYQRDRSCPAVSSVPDIAMLRIWHEGERNFTYRTRAYTPLENIRFRFQAYNVSASSGTLSTDAYLYVDDTWVSTTRVTASTTREGGWEGQFGYIGICSGASDTIRVVLDPSDLMFEENESNNDLSVTWDCPVAPSSGNKPDLIILDYWMTPLGDYEYSMGYRIKNQGKEYTLLTETGVYIDGEYRFVEGVERLAPGESRDVEISHRYSYRQCSGETDTIRLVSDQMDRVSEMDETNNGYEIPLTCIHISEPVISKPDLVIHSVRYECEIPCHDYTIEYTVHNRGNARAGPSVAVLYINYAEVGTGHVPALDAGAYSTDLTLTTTWVPVSPENRYHVEMCADWGNVVDERTPEPSGEENQCLEEDWEIAPSCHDGIWNGAEEDVDCGGSCRECGMVAVTGRILFEDYDDAASTYMGQYPARRVHFRIADDRKSDYEGGITSLHTTTDDGRFSVVLDRESHRGKPLKIRIGSCRDFNAGINYATKVAYDVDNCNVYVKWTSDIFTLPETGDLNLGDLIVKKDTDDDFQFFLGFKEYGSVDPCSEIGGCSNRQEDRDGGSVYFSIADAILHGREYANAHRGETDDIGMPTVQYPDRRWNMYYPPEYIIDIAGPPQYHDRDEGFSDDSVLHEYGHFLAYRISHLEPWGGSHGLCTQKNQYLAWNEGWAEYFGTLVVHHDQYPRTPGTFTSLNGPSNLYSTIEEHSCGDAGDDGDEIESYVSQVLWDLADDTTWLDSDPLEAWDTVEGHEDLTFKIFDREFGGGTGGAYLGTMCNFLNYGWYDDDYDSLRGVNANEITDLLDHYGIDC